MGIVWRSWATDSFGEGITHIIIEWVGILCYNHFADGEKINYLHIWGKGPCFVGTLRIELSLNSIGEQIGAFVKY